MIIIVVNDIGIENQNNSMYVMVLEDCNLLDQRETLLTQSQSSGR